MLKYIFVFCVTLVFLCLTSCGEAYQNKRFTEPKYYVGHDSKFQAQLINGKDTISRELNRSFFKLDPAVDQIILFDVYFNHLDTLKRVYFYSNFPLQAYLEKDSSIDTIPCKRGEKFFEISFDLAPKINTQVRYQLINEKSKSFCFADFVHEYDRRYLAYQSQTLNQNLLQGNLPWLRFMAQGAFLILALYHLMIFIQTRQRVYLFYTLFVFSNFIYFLKYLPWQAMFAYLEENPWLYFLFLMVTCGQILTYIFYMLFIEVYLRRFLKNIGDYSIGLKLIRVYLLISIILFFVLFYLYYSDRHEAAFLSYNGFRIFAMIFGIYINYYFIRRWNSAIAYLVIGGVIILVGGILSWFSAAGILFQNWYMESLDFLLVASILEVITFSLGMGKQVMNLEQEKNLNQQKLINQLQENEKLQTNLNEGLERQLNLEQEVSKLAKFEKQLIGSELSALRSQMNPHFLFNSLNSLKLYVLDKEPALAAKYLDQFAKMYRKILNNSRQQLVTIDEEIELLKLYIQAETIRFKNKINVVFKIGDEFDTSFTKIPPMLLQPIVENAIWHGLRNKTSDDHRLIFTFDLEENGDADVLKISIEDNGVGRNAKETGDKAHKSLATTIIKERLELLETVHDCKCSFQIIDLKDDNNKPLGTRVEMSLPGEL